MISGIFHQGSGLGNQLHRYVGSKVLALDRGEIHCMVAPELFKGSSFMDLPMIDAERSYHIEYPAGKVVVDDPKSITLVDEEFQGERDFMHRIGEVREWLRVEILDMSSDLCVIGFRGGEYKIFPELYLPKEYWEKAVGKMREINPDMRFEVHTDDPAEAFAMLGELLPAGTSFIHDMGLNWRSVRYAKYLIVANSSFYI